MKLSALRFIIVPILFSLSQMAQAKPVYYNQLRSFYGDIPEVAKRRCQNCHTSNGLSLNPYGKDFAEIKLELGAFQEVVLALEPLDSDEDGIENVVELEAGTDPGNSNSF